MRRTVLPVLLMSCLAGASAQSQQPYYSLGGYGNVLYPGTGHAPNAAYANNFHGGGPGSGGGANGGGRGGPNHGSGHGRTVVVPYPVYYGSYPNYYDNGGQGQQPEQPVNQAPSVVINQTFVPDRISPTVQEYGDQPSGMKLYQAPPGPYQQQPQDQDAPAAARPRVAAVGNDQPTLYLIAFRDHSIVQALGYWMEGGVLHYVSVEHTLNQASLDLIDRTLSQRLNDERGVEFKLPAAQLPAAQLPTAQ
jgi:hypothetical protein